MQPTSASSSNLQISLSDAPVSLAADADGVQQTIDVGTHPPISRRGRYHAFKRPPISPNLFPEGKVHRIASNRLIWEGCNILTHGEKLGWISEGESSPYYESIVAKGKGFISFWVTNDFYSKHPAVLEGEARSR